MALVNTEEFQTIGIIMGAVFVMGIIYFIILLNNKSAHTPRVSHRGGRRKRPRQMKKKRR